MKMLMTLGAVLFMSAQLSAQATKKPATAKPASTAKPVGTSKPVGTAKTAGAAKPSGTAKKPAGAAPVAFKNSVDSFSYALGLSLANFYKNEGVQEINSAFIVKALNDVKAGKQQFNEEQINSCIMGFMQAAKSEKAAGAKKEGQAFLALNKTKPGVVTTASGLQYTIITEGTGAKPTAADQVKVHYTGSLLDGFIFDSSVQRGEPLVLGLGNVIPGWTEALQLMPVGSKWKLFIPSDLGYGDNGQGAIKPGSTLVFEVELLDIVK